MDLCNGAKQNKAMIAFVDFLNRKAESFVLKEANKVGVYSTKVGKVTIWIGDKNSYEANVIAKIGNKIVGKLILYRKQGLHGKNEIYKVAVDEPYKRSGIGTLMYKAAESEFGEIAPSAALSDEAFEFWKKYRPEVFSKDDLRLYKDKIIGKFVEHPKFGKLQIQSVARSVAIGKILTGEKAGYTTAVDYNMIIDQLGPLSQNDFNAT